MSALSPTSMNFLIVGIVLCVLAVIGLAGFIVHRTGKTAGLRDLAELVRSFSSLIK